MDLMGLESGMNFMFFLLIGALFIIALASKFGNLLKNIAIIAVIGVLAFRFYTGV